MKEEEVELLPEDDSEVEMLPEDSGVEMLPEEGPSMGQSFAGGFGEGASLGFKDEVIAASDAGKQFLADTFADSMEAAMSPTEDPSFSFAESYSRRKAYEEGYRKKLLNENPISYFAGEIAGTIAGTAATFGIGAYLAPARFANLGIKGAALVESGIGLVQGLGTSEEETIEGMAKDAAIGGALGAAGEVIGQGAILTRAAAADKKIAPRFLKFLGMQEEAVQEVLKGKKPVGEWAKRILNYTDDQGKPIINTLHTKKEMLANVNKQMRNEWGVMGKTLREIDEIAPIDYNSAAHLYDNIDAMFDGPEGFLSKILDPDLESQVQTLRRKMYRTFYEEKKFDKNGMWLNPYELKEKVNMSSLHDFNSMAWSDLMSSRKSNASSSEKRLVNTRVEIAKEISSFIDNHIKQAEDVIGEDLFGNYSVSRMRYGDMKELTTTLAMAQKKNPGKTFMSNLFTKAVIGYGSAGYLLSQGAGLPSKEVSLAAAGLLAVGASPRMNLIFAKSANRTAQLMKKHADRAAPIAGKLLAAAANGSENFYDQYQIASSQMEFIDEPLARTTDEVMRRKDALLTFLQATNSDVAGQLRIAIEEGNNGAIQEIMAQVVKNAPTGMIKGGLGWDGRAVTPEDSEAVNAYINGITDTRERMNTKVQFDKDQMIPVKMFAPEKKDVLNQFLHPKSVRKPGKPSI